MAKTGLEGGQKGRNWPGRDRQKETRRSGFWSPPKVVRNFGGNKGGGYPLFRIQSAGLLEPIGDLIG